MRCIRFLLLLLSLPFAAFAAQPATSPLVGTWTADVSKLPMPEAARPRSVTITFGQADDGRWSTRVEVVTADGGTLHAASVAALDGRPVPVEGDLEADTTTVAMPAPGVLVMQLSLAGVPGSTRIYTLGPDGQTLVETAANFGDDGKPYMRTNHFRRVGASR